MTKDPGRRLGSSDEGDIRRHRFFAHMDWEALEQRKVKPQFVPKIADHLDTSNFDAEFTSEEPDFTPITTTKLNRTQQNEFSKFSFVNNEFQKHTSNEAL